MHPLNLSTHHIVTVLILSTLLTFGLSYGAPPPGPPPGQYGGGYQNQPSYGAPPPGPPPPQQYHHQRQDLAYNNNAPSYGASAPAYGGGDGGAYHRSHNSGGGGYGSGGWQPPAGQGVPDHYAVGSVQLPRLTPSYVCDLSLIWDSPVRQIVWV
jgi:hypothetical protein